jgi:hypothetical protein
LLTLYFTVKKLSKEIETFYQFFLRFLEKLTLLNGDREAALRDRV